MGKSTVFFGSVPSDIRSKITQILPFTVGTLPMRYLGVPLLAKKLCKSDCYSLIDKVRKKVYGWQNKKLSYAERLQLVASVLAAMQNYWAAVYILPNGVIDDIDKILKGFLWSQSGSAKGKARVAWKDVCLPKDQGGSGLKIIAHKDSLWGKWVNLIKLKGGSIWDVNVKYDDSWGWKFLMGMRDKIKPHVCIDNSGSIEHVLWVKNDGNKVDFSVNQVWKDLKCNNNVVGWHHVVWFKAFNPKHAIILWMAILGSLKVWNKIKAKLIFRGLSNSLQSIIDDMAQYPYTNNIWNIINRLVIAACVYFLWIERNLRLFQQKKRSIDEVWEGITKFIRLKLVSLKVKCSGAVIKAASIWNLQWANKSFRGCLL
ncbi:uncharacterized protein [Rutidosis leptorrhynchoides]|uniref:uncharacterized protein n=1 Tax=Rutidosis leptorrhynchoides TaxID=125765 RepID=UPI003A9A1860